MVCACSQYNAVMSMPTEWKDSWISATDLMKKTGKIENYM